MGKQIIFLLVLAATLAFVACQSKTIEDPVKVKQQVEEANAGYWGAMMAGDYDKIRSYCTDDVVLMPHQNEKMGIDGMIKQQEEGKKMGIKASNTPTILNVWSCGDMVYEVGTYVMEGTMAGMPEPKIDKGSYMCAWEKGEDGSLKRKYFIWNSSVAEEQPAVAPTASFEGNWELLSSAGTYPDDKGGLVKASFKKDSKNYHMKLIHNNYFMFTGQEMINGAAAPSYGYGTYTFEDNIYTEHIIYHVAKDTIGTSPSFETIVNGDTLIQKGPLKIGDFKDVNYEFTETYVRK